MTVTEELSSTDGGRGQRMAGFSARQSGDPSLLWHEFAEYPDGRIGVVIGSCPDDSQAQQLRTGTSTRLHGGADPAAVLDGLAASSASVLAAVIDRTESQMSYGSTGVAAPAVSAPEVPHRVLEPTGGRIESVDLPPGSSVLLCTRATVLDRPLPTNADRILDELLAGAGGPDDGIVVVLYRHPPAPLDITVAAEPASLAVVRRQLRSWLAMTGADDELCADILLAVGEAATNAAEHAPDGSGRPVQITVAARRIGDTLRFTVSDNGSWKTPTASNGHRGHGIRLMNALVDGVNVSTTAEGTTVEMLKELAG